MSGGSSPESPQRSEITTCILKTASTKVGGFCRGLREEPAVPSIHSQGGNDGPHAPARKVSGPLRGFRGGRKIGTECGSRAGRTPADAPDPQRLSEGHRGDGGSRGTWGPGGGARGFDPEGRRNVVANRDHRRRHRRPQRRADATGCGLCLHGLRSVTTSGRPHALGHHVLAERPDQRALRRIDRQQTQDDPRARQPVQDPDGRPAGGGACPFDRNRLLRRWLLHDHARERRFQSCLERR